MSSRAQVTSLEALEAFRASLIVYITRAQRVLDEVSDEVTRTRLWVQDDQREHWEREVRRRARIYEERQGELFSARLSPLHGAIQSEQLAAQKARRALDDATDRLNAVKRWGRQFENRVEPLAREVDRLRDFLSAHMGRAAQPLHETIRLLRDYAELAPPGSAADQSSAPPTVEPGSPSPRNSVSPS